MFRHLKSYFSHLPSRAVGIVFAINSFMFGNWVVRIPEIKDRLELSESDLGISLLGMSVGAMISMPFMGFLSKKLGAGKLTSIFVVMYLVAFILPVLADSMLFLIIAMIFVGITNGGTDVAMNAAAVAVEKKYDVSIMSTSHGMWSLGSMIGAAFGAIIAQNGISQLWHMAMMSALMLVLCLFLFKPLLAIKDQADQGKGFVLPKGPLLIMALITFCVMMGEGAIADWSALFIQNEAFGNRLQAGLGYTFYSLAMTLGRFFGDSIIPRFSKRKILVNSGLLATSGLLILVMIPTPIVSIIGLTLTGFGFSLLIPILFSAAADVKGISPGVGIAMVATLGYVGFLFGPPSIGFIAEEFNLKYGIGLIAILGILATVLSFFTKIRD